MTSSGAATVIAALLGTPLALLWIVGLLLYGALPVMAFSAMLNLKGIRRELHRLNDNLEAHNAGPRTGPLGI